MDPDKKPLVTQEATYSEVNDLTGTFKVPLTVPPAQLPGKESPDGVEWKPGTIGGDSAKPVEE